MDNERKTAEELLARMFDKMDQETIDHLLTIKGLVMEQIGDDRERAEGAAIIMSVISVMGATVHKLPPETEHERKMVVFHNSLQAFVAAMICDVDFCALTDR